MSTPHGDEDGNLGRVRVEVGAHVVDAHGDENGAELGEPRTLKELQDARLALRVQTLTLDLRLSQLRHLGHDGVRPQFSLLDLRAMVQTVGGISNSF